MSAEHPELTHAQVHRLFCELDTRLHKLRQLAVYMRTGLPVPAAGPVGRDGSFYERLKDPAVALFEMGNLSKQIQEIQEQMDILKARREKQLREQADLQSLPHSTVYALMRSMAKGHGIEVN